MLRKLFKFHGGVKPETNKSSSTAQPIASVPLPDRLVIPLHQSVGGHPRPLVKPGDKVFKGQRIGGADGNLSSAVHASTSGIVRDVAPAVMPHTSGLTTLSVIVEPDGEDRWGELERINFRAATPDELRDYLRDAGVVGLGGAVFPSHLKLKPGAGGRLKTLIINGAECEPYITCDDMLMRERPVNMLKGIIAMRHMLQAEEVLIGIEDNKPEAIAAVRGAITASGESGIEAIAIPTCYPAGGAKQLIRVLTGIEVPHGQRSTDYGVQCFNVGTAYSIHEALEFGRPLISRVVTVAGNVDSPRNYEVLLGTPMDHVVRLAVPRPDTDRYIMGGPMMGTRMPSFEVPVVKAANCILVGSPSLFPPPPPEMPCIRCGECAKACPADLAPFEMYWFSRSKNFGKAQEYHLFDCIECGCCSYVCPSHIPLVDYFRFSKGEIWAREREKEAADTARERFEFKNLRQEREKQEKAEKLAAKASATREKLATPGATTPAASKTEEGPTPARPSADDAKRALIEAAMEKARQQKAQVLPKNTEVSSPEIQAEMAAIDARRATTGATGAQAPAPPAEPSQPSNPQA
ncbi:electron transport complex subunit RsxC [Zoogloea sp.]|uniref:electron transport complex subunit RsxC n=1 Tax=Zoogloea sp. TaxID=49181 RepID=UPI0026398DBE|nr:electron transport complex subunit RsxC [Zoogloea sp.]MDD3355255.1 electron transport complex subunit RsxC [Zoogloea sp.]